MALWSSVATQSLFSIKGDASLPKKATFSSDDFKY